MRESMVDFAVACRWIFVASVALLAAHAQVQLTGLVGGEKIVVDGVVNGQAVYEQRGVRLVVPPETPLVLAPAPSYAAPTGAVNVAYYFENAPLPGGEERSTTKIEWAAKYKADSPSPNLYMVAAWEVDGTIVASEIRPYFGASSREGGRMGGFIWIRSTDRRGHLRVYVFQGDRSLSAVGRREANLMPLRALLDAGDFKGAKAWLEQAGRGAELSLALVEQIARSGDAALLERAVAGPNAGLLKRDRGAALLVAAAQSGRAECVALLLRLGVNPNSVAPGPRDEAEASALNWAAAAGSTPTIEALLAAKANPNTKPYPALLAAFKGTDLAGINLLLRAGAQWPTKAEFDRYFVQMIGQHRADVVQLFLEHGANPNQLWDGGPVLYNAATTDDNATLQILLKAGANPELPNADGQTPIMGAAFAGNASQINVLREAGASLRATDRDGLTAAAYAAAGGHSHLARTLLDAAPLTGLPASRMLHEALRRDDGELVTLLAARGAGVALNQRDTDEALDHVIRLGNRRLLRKALDDGMDPNRRIFSDWTLAAVAERYHASELLALLEERANGHLDRSAPQVVAGEVPLASVMKGAVFFKEVPPEQIGTAKVEVVVSAMGLPRFPVLLSASNDVVGRAAMHDASMGVVFPGVRDAATSWRRTTLNYATVRRTAEGGTYRQGEVSVIPLRTDNFVPQIPVGGSVPQAAVLKFVVNEKGEVESPSLLSSSTPDVRDAATALVAKWHFKPAQKDGKAVKCEQISMVLVPSGAMILPNTFLVVGVADPNVPPLPKPRMPLTLMARDYHNPGPPIPASRGIVVTQMTVDRAGFTRNVRVLGASDQELAVRAKFVADSMEFAVEPNAPEQAVIWITVVGSWND